ncbi:MAG: hypothetical protein OEW77_08095, partial [Gemmatimonadota bacterium]|nr:hypothetical protein [Gemmatimonadota bacterium]
MTAPASRRALRTLFVIATLVTQTHPCGAQALSASVEGTLASLDPLAKGVVVFLRRVDTMGRATAPTAASIDQRGLQFLPRTVA